MNNLALAAVALALPASVLSVPAKAGFEPANTTLVTAMYKNVLHRAPDAVGLAYWVKPGLNAAQLLQAFAQSTEFINDTMAPIATFLIDISSPGTSGQTYPTGSLFIIGLLPSYDDAYANWSNAGLQSVGGIPNRTTICATVNPLGGGQDDFTNIQNAINNCKAGEVVQLGAGAFSVHLADLPIHISTGIVLRGTGDCSGSSSPYCQTSITVVDGALAYTRREVRYQYV